MQPTQKLFLLLAFSLTGIFLACRQQAGKISREVNNMHIPLSALDSSALSIDKSPMDMIYFPADYPKEKMIFPDLANPLARVIYSRPQRNGRIIFADSSVTKNFIQHYGQEWRLGANESTEIEFFKPATIGGKKIGAGRYIIYCIPAPDKWKVFFNSNLFSWGLHMDRSKDVASVELPIMKNDKNTEFFTMLFQKNQQGCEMLMMWGDIKVVMPISFD